MRMTTREIEPNDRYAAKFRLDPERPEDCAGTGLTPDAAFECYLEHFLATDAEEYLLDDEGEDGGPVGNPFEVDVEIWTITWADELNERQRFWGEGEADDYAGMFVVGKPVEKRRVRCEKTGEEWRFEVV